jgi:hypothetical protein
MLNRHKIELKMKKEPEKQRNRDLNPLIKMIFAIFAVSNISAQSTIEER